MPASIVNISLLLSTDTGLQNGLQGVIANGLTLTSYTDGTGVPTLSNGRTGEIASALYRVEDGDFAVDITAVSGDGTYYIYIEDTGSAITAKALSTVPTWSGAKGGFYNVNAKAFFRFVKSGSNYNYRANLIQTVGYIPSTVDTLDIANLYINGSVFRQSFTTTSTLDPSGLTEFNLFDITTVNGQSFFGKIQISLDSSNYIYDLTVTGTVDNLTNISGKIEILSSTWIVDQSYDGDITITSIVFDYPYMKININNATANTFGTIITSTLQYI